MSFEYLNNFKSNVSDISIVQSVLAKSPGALISDKYFPVIEEAENGNFDAKCEMAHLFTNGGEGIKTNYTLAVYYADQILDWALNQQNDPYVRVENLKNRGVIEGMEHNWEEARKYFLQAFRIMVNNFEPENWDMSVYDFLEAVILELNPDLAQEE